MCPFSPIVDTIAPSIAQSSLPLGTDTYKQFLSLSHTQVLSGCTIRTVHMNLDMSDIQDIPI